MSLIGVNPDQGLEEVDLTNHPYCNNNACMSESQSKINDQNLGHSDDSEYTLATDQLYKIWFNSNPDFFLNEKNQLRLEKLRIDNPNAQISLVYSEKLISQATKKEAKEFLDIHHINMIDFDRTLKQASDNKAFPAVELKLLTLAEEELDNLGNKGNGGGNFAAASDILRFCPSIAQLGIYSDFDVHLKFNDITSSFAISSSIIIPDNNNDFVAFAKSEDGQNIHQNALKEIYKIQNAILNEYQTHDSITEYRAAIKSKNIYDELEKIFKEHEKNLINDYSGIDRAKLPLNLERLKLARTLTVTEAEGLFCDIQDDLMYFLYKDFPSLRPETLDSIFESIRNNIYNYAIVDEKIQNDILNYKSLARIDLEFLLRKVAYLYKKNENILSSDIRSNYCHLAVETKLLGEKSRLYKESVMFYSGPEILRNLYSVGREALSPKTNKLNGIVRADGLDGSWYFK